MDKVISFDCRIAKLLGVDKAVIVYRLYGWVRHNCLVGVNMHDGKVWTHNTIEALSKDDALCYMTPSKIKRLLSEMIAEGYLEKGNYNKSRLDRTSWYAFGERSLKMFEELGIGNPSIVQKWTMDCPKMDTGLSKNEPTIPLIITNNNYIKKENNIKEKKQAFERPSVEEVEAYCRERGGLVDAHRFVDYYEANGWKVGKNAMKDWKAAVRLWEKNSKNEKDRHKVCKGGFESLDYGDGTL